MNLPELAGWTAQRVPAYRARKDYVCPHCGNRVAAGTGHVVAWPDDEVGDRRHWHHHCWKLVAGRGRIA